MSTVFTSSPTIDDLIRFEVDQLYCREEGVLKNASGAAMVAADSVLGQPINNNSGVFELLKAADASQADGIVISKKPIVALANGASTTEKYVVLLRGPAVLNKDKIADADLAAGHAAFNKTTVATGLAASLIQAKLIEPTIAAEQTT